MSLADVKHQGYAQRALQQALCRSRTPHGYLFHGPEGVGKEMLARGMAELLLCEAPVECEASDPSIGVERLRQGCGQCTDCRLVAAGTHPDLHVVHRQLIREHPDPDMRKRKGLDLVVDVVRLFVTEPAGRTAGRGRAKVFILRNADEMNTQAQNALLKTLEEPPGPTFLLLLASSLDQLLPTTQSRCQVVRFNALPVDFVRARLKEMRPMLSSEALEWYTAVSEGSLGRCLEEVDSDCFAVNNSVLEVLSRGADPGALTETWSKLAKNLGGWFQKQDPDISDTEANRRGSRAVLRMTANWYADVIRTAAGRADDVANTQWLSALANHAQQAGLEACAAAIQRTVRAERQLDLNVNTELCLEALAGELAGLPSGRSSFRT